MKVFRNPYEAGKHFPSAVAAIGKFDGLHLGHQRVINLALRRAQALATKCLVLTFDPLPEEYFQPASRKTLVTLREKLDLFREMGVDAAVLLPFNRHLACQAPEAFVKDILSKGLKVVDVYVGKDFCFGKDRAGRVDDLKVLGRRYGFLVHPVPLLTRGREKISSSLIRRLIEEGHRKQAECCLGRKLGGGAKKRSSPRRRPPTP